MSCYIEVVLYGGIVPSVVYRSAFNRLWLFRYEDIICRCPFILCSVIWCIVGLLVSRFVLHFLLVVVVSFPCTAIWYIVLVFTRSLWV